MNRHQRRAATKREFQAGVRAMAREANGVVKITTVRPEDYLALLADTIAGRTDCIPLLGTVADLQGRVNKARETGRGLLCAACPAELTGGYAIIIIHEVSYSGEKVTGWTNGIPVQSEDRAGILRELAHMVQAYRRPVLDAKTGLKVEPEIDISERIHEAGAVLNQAAEDAGSPHVH